MKQNMHYHRSALFSCVFLVLSVAVSAAASGAGAEQPAYGFPGKRTEVRPFPLEQVRLLEGPFRRARRRDAEYLLSLDVDRLLHTWRKNAGLPTDAEPLGGWERPDCELRGHFLGHYLSACSLMYAATGNGRFRDRTQRVVAALAKCQEALDAGGYESAFPESFIDRVLNRRDVWAPFYTLHKVLAGLLDAHRYCDSRRALGIARRFADWLHGRLEPVSEKEMQKILNSTEQGGMNEALANLYAATGEEKYLKLAERFQQDSYIRPLAGGEDNLTGEHANSFIPNIVGTARLYELSGRPFYRKVARHFWNVVVHTRAYCTGGTSLQEHWGEPNVLPLGGHTQEFCCTYNMLKLTRHLTCMGPKAAYGDYYERALWNSILSEQNPETGMMGYFQPLASGRWKYFNTPRTSFWCCTGTGVESHAKYGRNIYFQGDGELYVNQFIASEVAWAGKQVSVRQETGFPAKERTTLRIECPQPTEFTLHVRIPSWAGDGAAMAVNDGALSREVEPGSYAALERIWRDGDRVVVSLPMSLHAVSLPQEDNRVAVMYGPLVLAGKLSAEGLTRKKVHTNSNWYDFSKHGKIGPDPIIRGNPERPSEWVKPVQGEPLTFRTVDQEKNFRLIPLHRLFGRRYVVYWRVYRQGSEEYRELMRRRRARKRREARTVDEVEIGVAESEKAHDVQGKTTRTGTHQGRRWRDAAGGGWFSYRLKLPSKAPASLACTYWGSDSGSRTFDILVDGQKIATETLDNDRPGEFFTVEYPIPEDLTKGKETITVRFDAHPGSMAGGVFGLAVLKREK